MSDRIGGEQHKTWTVSLREALALGRARFKAGESLPLGDLVGALGESSVALTTFLLALPFLWPLSLGPITTPASVLILIIGYRMARGDRDFPLPRKYLKVRMPKWVFRITRRVAIGLSWRFKWHRLDPDDTVKPGKAQRRVCGWGVVAGALLLAVPIPMLPLTNTFPAAAIIAFSIADLRAKSGYLTVGFGALALSLLIFAALGVVAYSLGWQFLAKFNPVG